MAKDHSGGSNCSITIKYPCYSFLRAPIDYVYCRPSHASEHSFVGQPSLYFVFLIIAHEYSYVSPIRKIVGPR